MYAAVRLKGPANMDQEMKDTLEILNLTRTNHCVLLPETPDSRGMLEKVKEFITYGEADKESVNKLIQKRGRTPEGKKLEEKEAERIIKDILKGKTTRNSGIKPIFRLSPPSRGLKTTKRYYPKGALGYRGKDINELLNRMI